MKRIFFSALFLLLLVGFKKTDAQCVLTLSDLTKTSLLSSDDFETFVLNRGYSLSPVKGDGDYDFQQYFCDNKRFNGSQDISSRLKMNYINPHITFSTTDKQPYLTFKNELTNKGYKFQYKKDQPVGELTATYYYYSNGTYQVDYYSYYLPQSGLTWYVMDLWKL